MKRIIGYSRYIMIYGGYYFAMALFSVLISVYLMDKGQGAVEVSFLVSAASVMSMVFQPVIGMLQDIGNQKTVTVAILLISAGTGILFSTGNTYGLLVILYGVTMALINSANPYIEMIAMKSPYSYRSIRIWGSIGYATGAQVCGIIYEAISPESNYYIFAAFIAMAAWGVAAVKGMDSAEDRENRKEENGYKKAVLGNGMFWKYMILASVFYGVTNLNSTYLPVYYQENGLSVTMASTVLFLATLMELPVIFTAHRYMNRLSNTLLLGALFGAMILQFAAYVLMPVTVVRMMATIILKSSVTMAYIMVNMKVVSSVVSPRYQMSALTLVSALGKNLTTIVMQNISGVLVDTLTTKGLYMVLLGLVILGFVFVWMFRIPTSETEKMAF